jgi:hypothetical protein
VAGIKARQYPPGEAVQRSRSGQPQLVIVRPWLGQCREATHRLVRRAPPSGRVPQRRRMSRVSLVSRGRRQSPAFFLHERMVADVDRVDADILSRKDQESRRNAVVGCLVADLRPAGRGWPRCSRGSERQELIVRLCRLYR